MKSGKSELKKIKREEAERRAKEYVAPKKYTGMRERVKHGIITVDTALSVIKKSSEAGVFYSPSIVNWLEKKRRKDSRSNLNLINRKRREKRKVCPVKRLLKNLLDLWYENYVKAASKQSYRGVSWYSPYNQDFNKTIQGD